MDEHPVGTRQHTSLKRKRDACSSDFVEHFHTAKRHSGLAYVSLLNTPQASHITNTYTFDVFDDADDEMSEPELTDDDDSDDSCSENACEQKRRNVTTGKAGWHQVLKHADTIMEERIRKWSFDGLLKMQERLFGQCGQPQWPGSGYEAHGSWLHVGGHHQHSSDFEGGCSPYMAFLHMDDDECFPADGM